MHAALLAWRAALGPDAVREDAETLERYARDTSDYSQRALAVLFPADTEEVRIVVRIAAAHRVPVHPISTGRNWGYGTANPYRSNCVIVDLSRMCDIRAFDADLGLITLEPGVTQGSLRVWLDQHGLPFMVPTTGAGPGCSIVGNALERGYGITPIADHFAAVTALEAVLPDGSVYRSPMSAHGTMSGFKWGVGPYLDGMFTQSHVGIVTSMTVALSRRPECVEAFYFWIDDDLKLESAVDATRRILHEAGANVSGINLMSAARVLAMSAQHLDESGQPTRPAAESDIEVLARRAGAAPWMGAGALYGTSRHVKATRKLVRQVLTGVASRIVFMTPAKAGRIETLMRWLPGTRARRLAGMVDMMKQGLSLLEGIPGEVALPLAYWKSGPPPERDRHPSRDGCGLLWYAPIVPMRGSDARHFVDLVRRVCARYGFDAPITFTSVSARSFDCTLPLLFDRTDSAACTAAQACWDTLLSEGRRSGFIPYRVHARHAVSMVDEDQPFWTVARKLKDALDPLHILSPGRWDSQAKHGSPITHLPRTE
ncbi:FAD-binding oxidoreductase [Burkholderia sp. Bp8963]|nr:FAD-binding oxidoreductase [Burkholderia sp. Bp8963]